jgi:hypothetical protein
MGDRIFNRRIGVMIMSLVSIDRMPFPLFVISMVPYRSIKILAVIENGSQARS